MRDQDGVGERLRRLRKTRGFTQQQIAARAHVSLSLVKKVEQGTVPPSAAFVAGAAQALGVKPAHLYGTDEIEVVQEPQQAATLQELRAALDAYDDPRPNGRPLDLTVAARRVDTLSRHVSGLRYVDTAQQLPELLRHLYVLAAKPGHAGEQARALLHDAYRMVATVSARFRQSDLAAIASERHVQLAPSTGDPLRIAISAYHRSSRYLQLGDYRGGLRILDRARDHLDNSPAGTAIAAQLNLRSSVLAARAGDGAEADGYIDEARAITGDDTPASPYYNIDASPLNVVIHWCAAPVERHDGTEAVRRAETVTVADRKRPERVGHHHIDMARAWMLHGDRNQTLRHLNAARRIAPHNTRHHPSVRETVLTLAEADRRATDSLAGFARWAAIRV